MKTAESPYFNQHLPPDLKVSKSTLGSIAHASVLRPLGRHESIGVAKAPLVIAH